MLKFSMIIAEDIKSSLRNYVGSHIVRNSPPGTYCIALCSGYDAHVVLAWSLRCHALVNDIGMSWSPCRDVTSP
jgi:hypothetical protein